MTFSALEKAAHLLEWNKEKLTYQSKLHINDLSELFAESFIVIANDQHHNTNYKNYYEFLNEFRSNIKSIDYQIQEYIEDKSTIVIPLVATVHRVQGKKDVFDVMLLLKFNEAGKIIHWQEVYYIRK